MEWMRITSSFAYRALNWSPRVPRPPLSHCPHPGRPISEIGLVLVFSVTPFLKLLSQLVAPFTAITHLAMHFFLKALLCVLSVFGKLLFLPFGLSWIFPAPLLHRESGL